MVIFIYLFVVVLSLQRPNARDDSLSVCCRALPGTSLTSIAPPTLTECLSSCAMALRALGWPPLRAIVSRRLTLQVARFHAASSASAVQYAVIFIRSVFVFVASRSGHISFSRCKYQWIFRREKEFTSRKSIVDSRLIWVLNLRVEIRKNGRPRFRECHGSRQDFCS